MKHIHLKCDNAFFYKMVEDKYRREKQLGYPINWEEYIELLFGFAKYIK